MSNIKKQTMKIGLDKNDREQIFNALRASLNGFDIKGVAPVETILAKTQDEGIFVGQDTGDWYYWHDIAYTKGGSYIAQSNCVDLGTIKGSSTEDILKSIYTTIEGFENSNKIYIVRGTSLLHMFSGLFICVRVNGLVYVQHITEKNKQEYTIKKELNNRIVINYISTGSAITDTINVPPTEDGNTGTFKFNDGYIEFVDTLNLAEPSVRGGIYTEYLTGGLELGSAYGITLFDTETDIQYFRGYTEHNEDSGIFNAYISMCCTEFSIESKDTGSYIIYTYTSDGYDYICLNGFLDICDPLGDLRLWIDDTGTYVQGNLNVERGGVFVKSTDGNGDTSSFSLGNGIATIHNGYLQITDKNNNRMAFGRNETNSDTDTFEIYCMTDHLLFMSNQDTPALQINTVNGKSLYLNEDINNTESDIYEFYIAQNGYMFYNVNDEPLLRLHEDGQEVYKELTINTGYDKVKVTEALENLNAKIQGLDFVESTVSSNTNELTVPETAQPIGMVDIVGGNTYTSENLLVLDTFGPASVTGITCTFENNELILNGTATAAAHFFSNYIWLDVPSETKFVSFLSGSLDGNEEMVDNTCLVIACADDTEGNPWKGNLSYNKNKSGIYSSSPTFSSGRIQRICIQVRQGAILDNVRIKLMLVKGSTVPTEWSEGYTGFRHSACTSTFSQGKNLVVLADTGDTTNNNVTYSVKDGVITVKKITTASPTFFVRLAKNITPGTYAAKAFCERDLYLKFTDINKDNGYNITAPTTRGSTMSPKTDRVYISIGLSGSGLPVNTDTNLEIRPYVMASNNYNDIPSKFTPHLEPKTKLIPQSIQELDGREVKELLGV